MDNQEFNNVYSIPANYTDSGKLFGGMLETRNTVEAAIVVLLIGYPELMWLHVSLTAKVIIMTVTLLPIGILALMGIGGDSLFQYAGHVIRYWLSRRKLHYRRVGYRYEPETLKYKKAGQSKKKAKARKKKEAGEA